MIEAEEREEGRRGDICQRTPHKHPVRVITTNDKQIQMMDHNSGGIKHYTGTDCQYNSELTSLENNNKRLFDFPQPLVQSDLNYILSCIKFVTFGIVPTVSSDDSW